jgi:hypothetical protein
MAHVVDFVNDMTTLCVHALNWFFYTGNVLWALACGKMPSKLESCLITEYCGIPYLTKNRILRILCIYVLLLNIVLAEVL